MFENLTEHLTRTFKNIRGQGRLSEENIQQALRDVRLSLLEADVALPVVKHFIDQVKEQALGQEVDLHLQADQAFIKLLHAELIKTLGNEHCEINFKAQPPVVILLAGLQGAGKTTSAAKLARYLQENKNKKVLLASVDTYRPAAIEQLKQLAQQINIPFYTHPHSGDNPVKIAAAALESAKKQYFDAVIIDTAGRLHVDEHMMEEIKSLHAVLKPTETLFVVDSMIGQDAVNTAKVFNDALPLTGVILTKTDGDARGGAALSVKYIIGKPIKFVGDGEKINALEPFHPDRIASRILGMGDILSLIEEVERKADKQSNEKLAKKIKKGHGFDLEDFKQQLLQMNNMGGITGMMSKLPGLSQFSQQASNYTNEKIINKTLAIINSMTRLEKRIPKIIAGSRKKRIALGSGCQIQDVNRLLKQYEQMQKMMKKISKPGAMKQMMRGLGGIKGMKDIFLP